MTINAVDTVSKQAVDILANTQSLQVWMASLLNGELSQFNRLAGGAITPYSTAIGTTTTTTVVNGACIYYGLYILSSGTGTVNIWDGTSSAGTTWLPASAPTSANSFMPALGPGTAGTGVLFNTGLTVQNSTAGTVYYPVVVLSA